MVSMTMVMMTMMMIVWNEVMQVVVTAWGNEHRQGKRGPGAAAASATVKYDGDAAAEDVEDDEVDDDDDEDGDICLQDICHRLVIRVDWIAATRSASYGKGGVHHSGGAAEDE